ncbi:MAG: hypothetical protein RLN75_04700, partial [Longimicrobiales bacterium]
TPLEVWVAPPVAGAMPLPAPPYPVLWVLDANLFFGTVVETTRLMAQLFGELPPLIVAGLAYPGVDARLHAELRGRDCTPTLDAGFAASARTLPGYEPTLPEGERLGGAAAFAERLLGPARQVVHDAYEAKPGADVLFGSSLGGLFVVDLFQRRPDAFAAWIAVSPALWWDDGLVLRRAQTRPADAPPRRGAVHLAVGRGEEGDHLPFLAPWRMVSNVEVLAAALAGREEPELRVAHAVVDGETHTSVVQPGLTRGLRWVFGGRPVS